MDEGTAPVEVLRACGHTPGSGLAVPVGRQHKVNAPCGEQERKYFGLGAHGLVPVIIPLPLNSLIQITCVQPLLGIGDPLHDSWVDLHDDIRTVHRDPRLRDAVAIAPEGICIRSERIVAFVLKLLCCVLHLSPVRYDCSDFFRIVSAEDFFRNVTTIDQQARAALPCGSALYAVRIRSHDLGIFILICQILVRINTEVGERHSDVNVLVGILHDIVRLGQEQIHFVVSGSTILSQKSLIKLLLIYSVRVRIYDPMNLAAISEIRDCAIIGSMVNFVIHCFHTGLELVIPAVDVYDFTFLPGNGFTPTGSCRTAGTAAARSEQTGQHQRSQ